MDFQFKPLLCTNVLVTIGKLVVNLTFYRPRDRITDWWHNYATVRFNYAWRSIVAPNSQPQLLMKSPNSRFLSVPRSTELHKTDILKRTQFQKE